MKYTWLVLLLPYVCSTIATEDCISTYSQLERSIVKNSTTNLDNMLKVFFPPNEQSPGALNVTYHVKYSNGTDCKITFHWSQFVVLEVIRPELLEQLSYFVYHRHYDDDTYGELKGLDIYVPAPFCSQYTCPSYGTTDSDQFEQDCNEEKRDTPLALLNQFTTQVSIYMYMYWWSHVPAINFVQCSKCLV